MKITFYIFIAIILSIVANSLLNTDISSYKHFIGGLLLIWSGMIIETVCRNIWPNK